jgi:hypothetical protein
VVKEIDLKSIAVRLRGSNPLAPERERKRVSLFSLSFSKQAFRFLLLLLLLLLLLQPPLCGGQGR